MVIRSVTLALGLYFLAASSSGAAEVERIHGRNVDALSRSIQPIGGIQKRSPQNAQRHATGVGLDQEDALQLLHYFEDSTGSYYRYRQTHRGIPIFGQQVIVAETSNGQTRAVFGRMVRRVKSDIPDIRPRLTRLRAQKSATEFWAALVPESGRPYDVSSDLQIYIDPSQQAHLVYVVQFGMTGDQSAPPQSPLIVVNAKTGEILEFEDRDRRANATGPGSNKYGSYHYGTDRPYLDVLDGGAYCLLENSRVETFDNGGTNSKTTPNVAHGFPCHTNAGTGAEPLNDSHYHGGVANDMFEAYAGTTPLSGRIKIRAHYDSDGVAPGDDNAWWHAQSGTVLAGDGNTKFHPMTSLDLITHEVAHGFTRRFSNITGSPQSLAIDEAFSDMAGEAAEFYLNGSNDFLVFGAIKKMTAAERYMNNPPLDGASKDHASNVTSTTDPHYASGVFNKAFALLAQTSGWTTEKAFRVFARANRLFWENSTQFNEAACGVELSAETLGYSPTDVQAAFSAVGVYCGARWHRPTAIGVYGSGPPVFSFGDKTVRTIDEPLTGYYGMAVRGNVFRASGKRYIEFTVDHQSAAIEYPYSGGIYLGLRDQANGITEWAGDYGDWMVSWLVEAGDEPNSNNHPWYRGSGVAFFTNDPSNPFTPWNISEGDTIGIAVDLDTGKIWHSKNGVWLGDPAAGTNPEYDESLYGPLGNLSNKNVAPYLFVEFQDFKMTMRSSSNELVYPAPTGFTPWAD